MYKAKLVLHNQKYCIDLNLLVCALFTLLSGTIVLNKLELSGIKKLGFQSANDKGFVTVLNQLLNKNSVRQIAATLLEPIVKKQTTLIDSREREQNKLLKKYLKKFRYSHERYINVPGSTNILDEEINYFAIQSLFLIAGV